MPFEVGAAGESRFVEGLWASGGLFQTLGVQALLGRVFNRADDRHGCGAEGPVAVVSHRFWQGHFGGGADVIGRQLPVNGTPFTVIGVTPPGFFGPTVGRTFDVAVPLGCDVADHLRTPEDMAAYLETSIEEAAGDAAFVAKALGDIARARGMAQVASAAGLSRESLYKALSGDRVPNFDTVLRVVGALGLKLRAEAAPAVERQSG